MDITFFPYLVVVISILAIFYLPTGKDILVPIFLIPWFALRVEIGVGLNPSQLLFVVVAIKYFMQGTLQFKHVSMGPVAIAVLLGVFGALLTFNFYENTTVYTGGTLRNGSFRFLAVLMVFVLVILPFFLLTSIIHKINCISCLKTYIYSVIILSALGLYQLLYFRLFGVDIFPIGLFGVAEHDFKSAIFDVSGVSSIRISSMAGEPKSMGMHNAVAGIIVLSYSKQLFSSKMKRYFALGILLLTLYLTFSTSALLSFGLGFFFFLFMRIRNQPLSRVQINSIYLSSAFMLLSVYVFYVANFELLSWYERGITVTGTWEFIYYRTIGRIEVEDFDYVILSSFIADPFSFLFGRGFGLGHLFSDPFIPDAFRHYMDRVIVSPKSGVVLFLTNTGLFGMAMIILFLARCTPTLNTRHRDNSDTYNFDFIRTAQTALLPLVILLCLRTYVYETVFVIFAIFMTANKQMLMRHKSDVRRMMKWSGHTKALKSSPI